jgi:hypothetical protein
MESIQVRHVLFPEEFPGLNIEPLAKPAILRISPQICSRIGRAVFGLPANASCCLMQKRGVVCFYGYHVRPFRQFEVPVDQVGDAISAFISERIQHIDAKLTRIEWTGNRLDAYLEPAPEPEAGQLSQPAPEPDEHYRRSMQILEELAAQESS